VTELHYHRRWVEDTPLATLHLMRESLKRPPLGSEWYVKVWWNLRREAVNDEIQRQQKPKI